MKGFQPTLPKFNLLSRAIVIAVLAVTGLIMSATAQNVPHGLKTPPQQPLNLHPGNGSSATAPGGGINPDDSGWIFVNATNCYMYDSGGYTYLLLYPQQGGYYYTTSLPYQTMLMTACQTGNWIGIYEDGDGTWSQLYTYDYN